MFSHPVGKVCAVVPVPLLYNQLFHYKVFTFFVKSGEMIGLIKMLIGVAFLLVSLKVYNITFEDPKKKK